MSKKTPKAKVITVSVTAYRIICPHPGCELSVQHTSLKRSKFLMEQHMKYLHDDRRIQFEYQQDQGEQK